MSDYIYEGASSACSADITCERTRRGATNHGPSQEKGQGAAGYGSVKGTNTCTYATGKCLARGDKGSAAYPLSVCE
jgi:hypothetical protein